MTVAELAIELQLSSKSAYAAVARGDVPGVIRIGQRIRLSREAVNQWLRSGGAQRVKP